MLGLPGVGAPVAGVGPRGAGRLAVGLVLALVAVGVSPAAGLASGSSVGNPFCARLGHSIQASSGAQMFCFGVQQSTGGTISNALSSVAPNVDAASLREDVSPSGARAYGQSEESVAGVGPYVVEAWNDSTGFFSPCPSAQSKEELTGFGFSANGGASFQDLGGLPNSHCSSDVYFGDPSVEAWRSGGSSYFYVSSLYDRPDFTGVSKLAIAACKASGTGSTATIKCSQPITVAQSTECVQSHGQKFCSFLDKEFLSIDPQRGRLYMSYTEFGVSSATQSGTVDLAVCDIGTPGGGVGSSGGTAAKPVCSPGQTATPYLTVAHADPNCESEGAYPAVDVASGDVYVAYEFNWASNIFGPAPCLQTPTRNIVDRVRASCLTLPAASCGGPSNSTAVNVVSMDAAFVPGYNRFPASDFPRIAVSDASGTVSIVWNDARSHALGDILMHSYDLGTLASGGGNVRLNSDTGGMHFMPALRNSSVAGRLNVSWFQRGSANTASTNVKAALGINPRATVTPSTNVLITSGPSDWNAVSSDIVPNFGDYTDNYVLATASPPFVGTKLYVAWADGRFGVPQPFEQSTTVP